MMTFAIGLMAAFFLAAFIFFTSMVGTSIDLLLHGKAMPRYWQVRAFGYGLIAWVLIYLLGVIVQSVM